MNYFAFILKRLLSHQERFADVIKSCLETVRERSIELCGWLLVWVLSQGLADLGEADRAGTEFWHLGRWPRACSRGPGEEQGEGAGETAQGGCGDGTLQATRGRGGLAVLELLWEFTSRLKAEDRLVGVITPHQGVWVFHEKFVNMIFLSFSHSLDVYEFVFYFFGCV
jgi:hypothetical protein